MYKYRRVLYQPLKRQEALRCLKYFVSKTMAAVQNSHKLEFAHLDIGLPNLCIGQNFDVVLIDVDMSNDYDMRPESYIHDSCLYHVFEKHLITRL